MSIHPAEGDPPEKTMAARIEVSGQFAEHVIAAMA